MRYGSLFSGTGGFDLGFDRAGLECAWQVENDPYCLRVLEKHWPDVKRYGDIREVDWDEVEKVEVICGGFPCQPVSQAGKRKAQADERWLWPEFARAIGALRPRFVVVENVPGLLFRGMGDVLADLAAFGYDAEWQVLSAQAFGAPHLRQRVWIVAYPSFCPGVTSLTQSDEWQVEVGNVKGDETMAHTEGDGMEGERLPTEREIQVADTDGGRPWNFFSDADRESLGRIAESRNQCGQWSVEPDVGRVVTRFSLGLDGGGIDAHQSCKQKARTAGLPHKTAVPEVREPGKRTAPSPESRRCTICGVPLSVVPHHRRPGTWEMGEWEQETQDVRSVRVGVHELFTFESEDVRSGVSVGNWSAQFTQTVANRVDRLRGLGNAVVPQITEWLGRRLLEAMTP